MGLSSVSVRRAVLICALGALGLGAARAQNADPRSTTLIEPPSPLLPTTASLQSPAADSAIPAESGDAAAILHEDGLVRRAERTLHSGSAQGWVIAYQFGDSTGAYSAFTSFAAGGRARVNLNPSGKPGHEQMRAPDGDLVLLSGVSVVRVHSEAPADVLAPIVRSIDVVLPKIGGRRGFAPLLPTLLPQDGLDRASLRYALGPRAYANMGGVLPANLIDWNKSTEAITAKYAGGGVLTLLLCPTPQIAGDTGRTIEKAVNQIGPSHFGTVKLRRDGPLLAMTSGSFTPVHAEALVHSIRFNQIVSYDQKMPLEFHAEVGKTASLLENILVLTGILALAALLLGLFLGGARAGIRMLQGKPAASEPEFLTINLRNTPKAPFGANETTPPTRVS